MAELLRARDGHDLDQHDHRPCGTLAARPIVSCGTPLGDWGNNQVAESIYQDRQPSDTEGATAARDVDRDRDAVECTGEFSWECARECACFEALGKFKLPT